MRDVCEGKQKPQDNQRDYGQRDQLSTEERPVFAVREEVVDAFEGVKEGRADDVADGLEGGRGDGARVRHDKEEIVQWIPWEERKSRGWEVGGEDIYADIVLLF